MYFIYQFKTHQLTEHVILLGNLYIICQKCKLKITFGFFPFFKNQGTSLKEASADRQKHHLLSFQDYKDILISFQILFSIELVAYSICCLRKPL